jgi:hypothetical protein
MLSHSLSLSRLLSLSVSLFLSLSVSRSPSLSLSLSLALSFAPFYYSTSLAPYLQRLASNPFRLPSLVEGLQMAVDNHWQYDVNYIQVLEKVDFP